MAAIVQAQANQILTATLAIGGSNTIGATSPMKMKLTTTTPTASTVGTELIATGYTAGGQAISFGTASAGSASGPVSTAISWTNTAGSGSWTGILGLELWDTASTALRWWFGSWSGGTAIVIAAGNTFSVSVGAVTVTLT
jgi:hypothetical protein